MATKGQLLLEATPMGGHMTYSGQWEPPNCHVRDCGRACRERREWPAALMSLVA